MDFTARVRLVVDVPFQFDVDDSPAIELEPSPRREGALTLRDRQSYEEAHNRIQEQRVAVAKHAEKLAHSISVKEGQIVEVIVEGVEQA